MVDLHARRNLRTVCSEVLVLLVSAFIYSIAFPGLISANGIGFVAMVSLIPVFAVIRNTSWKLTPIYGFFYGFMFYLFFNYWLKTFHPLAILIVPIIKGGEMLVLFPVLKAAQRLFKKYGYLVEALVWVAYSYLSQDWFAGVPLWNPRVGRVPLSPSYPDFRNFWNLGSHLHLGDASDFPWCISSPLVQ
nr:hypothetical protein [uncultured Sphaerochaeta sp.]